MAPRRASTRAAAATPARGRRSTGGIRKNTRNRQAPNRYGHPEEIPARNRQTEDPSEPPSSSVETEPSIPQFSHSPYSNSPLPNSQAPSPNTMTPRPETPATPSEVHMHSSSSIVSEQPLNASTMRELLRSHEQEIIDRVILRVGVQNPTPHAPSPTNALLPWHIPQATLLQQPNPTLVRIAELERQLAQLKGECRPDPQPSQPSNPRALGTYNPVHPTIPFTSESASGMADTVETLFPGVERATLVQIIENRFKPTNIYRLLASEKERAESHRTINIGGVEFEQAEREGKESKYRMSSFFKAWATYTGILIKLAPHALQGELATTALAIYTMNLYDLLEKYTWEGVKAYHFQFHRKRVASGKGIYHPDEWHQLDSELVASKCFAHPHLTSRSTWGQGQKPVNASIRRPFEPPIRENTISNSFTASPITIPANSHYRIPGYHAIPNSTHPSTNQPSGAFTGTRQLVSQACRNWNFRECRSA